MKALTYLHLLKLFGNAGKKVKLLIIILNKLAITSAKTGPKAGRSGLWRWPEN